MTETVLVIGGTGELGAPVARQLHGDGYRVRLLVRTPIATRDRDQRWSTSGATWTTPAHCAAP
jgi:uncharacterized protein YbjT (DUF2867 family)